MADREGRGGKASDIEEANRKISRPDKADRRGSDSDKRLDRGAKPERAITTRRRASVVNDAVDRERRRED